MSKGSVFGGKAHGLRLERMRSSPRFLDGFFKNTAGVGPGLKPGTAFSTMGEFFLGGKERTPPNPLPFESPLATWARPVDTGLRATWLGHSTVLLEVDGLRVLTDPVWGERVSPWSFAGPKRFHPVPVTLAQLPPLDAVIISHDHYDHLDYPTILELARTEVPFYTSLGVGAHLEAWGVPPGRITELDWWESATLPRGGAAHHRRALAALLRPRAWETATARSGRRSSSRARRHKVFFSGDTGLTPEYAEIRQRLGPFDLVMLEVGAFHPAWGDIHLGPENALAGAEAARRRRVPAGALGHVQPRHPRVG